MAEENKCPRTFRIQKFVSSCSNTKFIGYGVEEYYFTQLERLNKGSYLSIFKMQLEGPCLQPSGILRKDNAIENLEATRAS